MTLVELFTSNFVVISTITLIDTYLFSSIFYLSYVFVFDRSFVTLIQYSDLNSLLITFAGLGAGLSIFSGHIETAITTVFSRPFKWMNLILGVVVQPSCILIVYLLSPKGTPAIFFIWAVLIWLLFLIVLDSYRRAMLINKINVIGGIRLFGSAAALTAGLGVLYAYYVRDIQENKHDVTIKTDDKSLETLHDARIILILSHHVMLILGPKVLLLQTSDVVRISSSH